MTSDQLEQFVVRARAALDQGDRFHQVEISQARSGRSVASILGRIEELGWRLDTAGYVFIPASTTSSSAVLTSGQNSTITGETVGIYLFRAEPGADYPTAPGRAR